MEKDFKLICENCNSGCVLKFSVNYNDIDSTDQVDNMIKTAVCPFGFTANWKEEII